jgi:hypothetical protein
MRLRGGRPVLGEALLMSVLLIGLYDQSNETFVPYYETAQNEYTSDALFVEAIDRGLPPQAGVFQLPYVTFPENVQPISRDRSLRAPKTLSPLNRLALELRRGKGAS